MVIIMGSRNSSAVNAATFHSSSVVQFVHRDDNGGTVEYFCPFKISANDVASARAFWIYVYKHEMNVHSGDYPRWTG